MTYITFENAGNLDARAFTVMGLSAKESDNPIGFFGTGLKYAFAIAMRREWKVWIQTGDGEEHPLTVEQSSFRNTAYLQPFFRDLPLPFTTEYGKNWQPWMAYRELTSNVLDESGDIILSERRALPAKGTVRIIIRSDELLDIHADRFKYFFEGTNLLDLGEWQHCQLSTNNPGVIYYRGIRVGEFNRTFNYSMNILSPMKLTEDRTLDSDSTWALSPKVSMAANFNEDLALELLTTDDKDAFLYHVPVYLSTDMASAVNRIAKHLYDTDQRTRIRPELLLDVIRIFGKEDELYVPASIRPSDEKIIREVLSYAREFGFTTAGIDIKWKRKLGDNKLGLAIGQTMYIAEKAFDQGFRTVLSTFIEEWIHIVKRQGDFTREFQDTILALLVRAMEDVREERKQRHEAENDDFRRRFLDTTGQ